MSLRRIIPEKDNIDLIHDLGYIIDDGRIQLDVPNRGPITIGEYNGSQPPTVQYDFRSLSQLAVATQFTLQMVSRGRSVEVKPSFLRSFVPKTA
jgi:hypothetical protein